jgi:hypothetical protein
MHAFLKKTERVAKSPHLELIVGMILMATGLIEAGETLFEDVASGDIGVHHGMIVLGFAHAFKAIPSVLTGMMLFVDAEDRERH